MTTSIFEKASKQKLRFETSKGFISTEQLWDLPLQSNTGKVKLDELAKEVSTKLKESEVESFVTKGKASNTDDKLRLDILKHVIDVRVAELEALSNQRANAERKRLLLDVLAEKRAANLASLTEEQIQAELDSLK